MSRMVRCPKSGGFFVPPKRSPFFPCGPCKEKELHLKYAESMAKTQPTVKLSRAPHSACCGAHTELITGTVVKVPDIQITNPTRHSRTPSWGVRTKYTPHYPKARPTTDYGVAEYQSYEISGLRYDYEEEVK